MPDGKKNPAITNMQPNLHVKLPRNSKNKIQNSDSSRRKTYLSLNPDLTPSPYSRPQDHIEEYNRIAATRLRLGSHHLKIEQGRWSRTPVEERLCDCGSGIQDEKHVLLYYDKTMTLRTSYNLQNIRTLYN